MNRCDYRKRGQYPEGFCPQFFKKRIKQRIPVSLQQTEDWNSLLRTEYMPDVVVGDFDSLSEGGSQYLEYL